MTKARFYNAGIILWHILDVYCKVLNGLLLVYFDLNNYAYVGFTLLTTEEEIRSFVNYIFFRCFP